MSSINGFGTLYYGWRHAADGTSTATKWIAVSWVPVIPCYRERLRVLTDYNKNNIQSELGGLIVSQIDTYEKLEKLPLSAKEVGITLIKTYLGLPLAWIAPIFLGLLVAVLAKRLGISDNPIGFMLAGSGLGLLNFLIQSVRAIRKARGWQPNVINSNSTFDLDATRPSI